MPKLMIKQLLFLKMLKCTAIIVFIALTACVHGGGVGYATGGGYSTGGYGGNVGYGAGGGGYGGGGYSGSQ